MCFTRCVNYMTGFKVDDGGLVVDSVREVDSVLHRPEVVLTF